MPNTSKTEQSMRSRSPALATPTDLSNKSVQAVCVELNKLVADAFALYVKTKNFHWHMSGPHFRDYHIMLDEQADQIFAAIDPLAERVRKLGGKTLRSISHIAELSRIQDDDREFVPPLEMLQTLVDDNKAVAENMRKAHKVCDDNDDVASASLIEIYIDETERRTWFLFESSRDADKGGH